MPLASTVTVLDLDVPSGELVIGGHLTALAPLPLGTDRYARRGCSRAEDSLARAQVHLLRLHLNAEQPVRLVQETATGRLRVVRARGRLPSGCVALTPRLTDCAHALEAMDSADYAAQMARLDLPETPIVRVKIQPGRWRFTVDYEQAAHWADEAPAEFCWAEAEWVEAASPIVRPAAPGPAADFHTSPAAALLRGLWPEAMGAYPHLAQLLAHVLASYGNGLRWHGGQLTDQPLRTAADTPAWQAGAKACGLPKGVRVPTFPALTTLGPLSMDTVRVRGDIRSVGLCAPLNADRHWLALALVLFASLAESPDVACGLTPSADAAARADLKTAYRQVCGLVTYAQRWSEVTQALVDLEAVLPLLRTPAPAFSVRQQALAARRAQGTASAVE
jgi:hypothetical protein